MDYNLGEKEVSEMEQILKKMGWASIITSLAFTIIGLIIAYNPNTTFKVISYVIGGIFIVYGIIKIIEYFNAKGEYDLYNYELVYGIMAILLGIIVMACSGMIETILRILIGIWIIYSAVMRLGLALKLQKIDSDNKIWVAVLLIALAILLCGLYIIATPGIIVMTIGVIMVVYAIMDIVEEIIFMKNVKDLM